VEHAVFRRYPARSGRRSQQPERQGRGLLRQERPIIRRIEYKGNKSVTESDILDAFKDKKVGLSVESQFDPTKITRAEVVLKALLAAHGHQFATVKPTYERIAATNAVKLVFNIDEGPR
jgi:outer membrane protein insertion porin family